MTTFYQVCVAAWIVCALVIGYSVGMIRGTRRGLHRSVTVADFTRLSRGE